MPIDRRITNGLAWTGALLVVAIPLADFVSGQFVTADKPQMAVVTEEPAVSTPQAGPATPPATAAPKAEAATGTPDPVATAGTRAPASGGDAVDSFLQSGKALPSYISDGGEAPPAAEAKPAKQPAAPAQTVDAQPRDDVAAVPSTGRITGFPTPVSERPTVAVRPPANTEPPLVIDRAPPVIGSGDIVTADDLQDWESGPLSEFLANRRGSSGDVVLPPDYDPDGFFLDQGPNNRSRANRFPPANGDDYFYPYAQ